MQSAECRMQNYCKRLVAVIAVILVLFTGYLIGLSGRYHGAIRDVANGEYEAALAEFEGLDTYQDSEVLAEYCRIMLDYDPTSEASVHRCYHALDDLALDNSALQVEFAKVTTEISTLYNFGGSK